MKFKIRPAEPNDASKISEMRIEGDFWYLHDPNVYSESTTRKWLENLGLTSKRFIIELIDGKLKSFVGVIRVDHIDYLNRNCYIGMDIHPDHRGQGYSAQLYEMILDYLFRALNMNVIYLEVLATNTRAIHIYKKLGFIKTGSFPFKILRDSKYINSLIYSLPHSIWKAKRNNYE